MFVRVEIICCFYKWHDVRQEKALNAVLKKCVFACQIVAANELAFKIGLLSDKPRLWDQNKKIIFLLHQLTPFNHSLLI
jgi:hypothetical protein